MPVTSTLLGSATGSGVDLAVPITVNQPAGSLVGVFAMASTGPVPTSNFQGFRSVPTDTESGTWAFGSPHATIGNTSASHFVSSEWTVCNVLSAIRTAGNPLVAGGSGPQPRAGCKTCGNMLLGLAMSTSGGGGGGDSVSIHWLTTTAATPTQTVAMVVAFAGLLDSVVTTDQSQYGNGDAYPDLGSNASALKWSVDLGVGSVPTPVGNCAVLTLAGAVGTSGWTPVNGTTEATVTDGTIFLGLSVDQLATGGVAVEPGGTFGGASSIAAANYQTVGLV